jgi:hypothetical protein
MWHVLGGGGERIHTAVWWKDLKEMYNLDDIDFNRKMTLNPILKKWNWMV